MQNGTRAIAQKLFSVLFASSLYASAASAGPVPVVENNMHLLKYDEFRRLTDQHQLEYVEMIQNFYQKIEAAGVPLPEEVEEAFAPVAPAAKWAWFVALLSGQQEAQAADNCTDSPFAHSFRGTPCCTDSSACTLWRKTGNAADSTSGNTNTAASNSAMPSMSNATFGLNGAQAPAGGFSAPAVRGPTNQANGAKTLPGATAQDSKDYEKQAPADVRCIYAGFPIYGKSCRRVNSVVIGDKTYDCQASVTAGSETAASAAAKKAKSNNDILCNPALFGTKDGKSICVPYAKRASATKECASKSDKESARKILKDHPEQFAKLNKALNSICLGADGTKASFKQALKNLGSSEKSIQKSMADVESTCVTFRAQFADVKPGEPATSPAGGTSAPAAAPSGGGSSNMEFGGT